MTSSLTDNGDLASQSSGTSAESASATQAPTLAPSASSTPSASAAPKKPKAPYIVPTELERPIQAQGGKIVWRYLIPITIIHLLAMLAFVPYFFSWTGLILGFIGITFFGSLGINLCYHRLLSHRSFKCKPWVEKTLVMIALCCMEDSPGRWVATHRMHHKESDTQPDPHSPLVSFFWSHIGWIVIQNRGLQNIMVYEKYARDILRQPFYFKLERNLTPIIVYVAHMLAFFAIPGGIAWAVTGSMWAGLQLGLSVVVWAVLLRTVIVWHITWSVNSLTHLFGYRSHETQDDSRNNWFVALVSNGEGWHNNHHASPSCASNWRRWWEFDLVYGFVLILEKLGLAWDVVHARPARVKAVGAGAEAVDAAALQDENEYPR